MTRHEITLRDQTVELVDGADAYEQEGPLTTFFRFDPDRDLVDAWSTRLASFRTTDIASIRRLDERAVPRLAAVTGPA